MYKHSHWRQLAVTYWILFQLLQYPVTSNGEPLQHLAQIFRSNTNLIIRYERHLLWEAAMPQKLQIMRNGKRITLRKKPANLYFIGYNQGNFASFNFSEERLLSNWKMLGPTNIYSGLGLHHQKAWFFTNPGTRILTDENGTQSRHAMPVQLHLFEGDLSAIEQVHSGYALQQREMLEAINLAPSSCVPGSIRLVGNAFIGTTRSGAAVTGTIVSTHGETVVIRWAIDSEPSLLCRYRFHSTKGGMTLSRWERTEKASFDESLRPGDIAYEFPFPIELGNAPETAAFLPYGFLANFDYIEFVHQIASGKTYYLDKATGQRKFVQKQGRQPPNEQPAPRSLVLALIFSASAVTLVALTIFLYRNHNKRIVE